MLILLRSSPEGLQSGSVADFQHQTVRGWGGARNTMVTVLAGKAQNFFLVNILNVAIRLNIVQYICT